MEEQKSFNLLLNYKRYPIPSKFDRLTKVSSKVYNQLIFNSPHQYFVESDVSEQVLKSYIKYWIEEEIPNINIYNFYEYSQLNGEFGLLTDILEMKKNEFSKDLDFYQALQNQNNSHRSEYEEIISQNLDQYLEKYGIEMLKLPPEILFNIFNHSKRQLMNHNLAYNLIKLEYKESQNSSIFILLSCLDGTKLSKENLEDSICNRSQHGNFMPDFGDTFVESSFQKQREMEMQILELNEKMKEQKLNHETEINEMKEMIKNQENEFLKQINEFKQLMKEQIMVKTNELYSLTENLKCLINQQNNRINESDFNTISKNQELLNKEISEIKTKMQNESLNNEINELKKKVQLQEDKINQIDKKQQNSLNSKYPQSRNSHSNDNIPKIDIKNNDSLRNYQQFYSSRLKEMTNNIKDSSSNSSFDIEDYLSKKINKNDSKNVFYSNNDQLYGVSLNELGDEDLYSPPNQQMSFRSSGIPKRQNYFSSDSDDFLTNNYSDSYQHSPKISLEIVPENNEENNVIPHRKKVRKVKKINPSSKKLVKGNNKK